MKLLIVCLAAAFGILAAFGVAVVLATPQDQCGAQFPCRFVGASHPTTPTTVDLRTSTSAPLSSNRINALVHMQGATMADIAPYRLELADDLATAKVQAETWLKAHPGMVLGGYFRPQRYLEKPAP